MLRVALLASPLFLVACAAPRTSALLASDASAVRVGPAHVDAVAASSEARPTPEPSSPLVEPGLAVAPVSATPGCLTAEGESLYANRFTVKGGYYGSSEDAIDDGYILNVSWMNFRSKFFAMELEVGYLDADGSDGGVDTDVWSMPIMLNGRFNAPIWVLDLYGGLGVGTLYYDVETSGALTADDSGFLWAGDAFAGATINLGDAIALGLEGKYYVTDEISDIDSGLDAFALMLTLGFSR